jgi:phage shock protein A
MQARANAIEELTTAGSLEDYTGGGDDIDRQLKQIAQGGQVDDELAKMKAELGQGSAPAEPPKELEPEKVEGETT